MIQGSGLQCKLVISAKPAGAPVTERAIPTVIFSAEPAVRRHFLRKWLKDPAALDPTVSDVVDWRYYRDRLEGVIRKIVTIPAALQGVANPVPRVPSIISPIHDVRDRRVQSRRIFQPFAQEMPPHGRFRRKDDRRDGPLRDRGARGFCRDH